MNRIKIFKALTYTLAVPTGFVALFSLFALLVALMNPAMLIPVFVMICVVVYVIVSFIFLNKTIVNKKTTKKIIKDLFKINGIIASIFAVMCLVDFVSLIFSPSIISEGITKAMAENPSSFPAPITNEMMIKFSWYFLSAIGIYAIMLAIHLIIGFRLIKEYASSFLQE
jgi:hypothetical protein